MGSGGLNENDLSEQMDQGDPETDEGTNADAASEYSSQLRRLSTAGQMPEITIPPEPQGKIDPRVTQKVRAMYQKHKFGGINYNEMIKSKKSYRNPSIYQKLIEFMEIDEGGSNFPKGVFDPKMHRNNKENDYLSIANAQRKLEERRQAAMKERSKIEFAAATKAAAVVEKTQTSSSKRSIP